MTDVMHLLDKRDFHVVNGICPCGPDIDVADGTIILWHIPMPDPLNTDVALFVRTA